jgi:hypothetical protein
LMFMVPYILVIYSYVQLSVELGSSNWSWTTCHHYPTPCLARPSHTSLNLTVENIWGCPSQYLLQWINSPKL